ncbi:Transcription factor Adf-1 [Eumeta japonica]|nr:Transcription factor Adf-1 [Eumeta japonica]
MTDDLIELVRQRKVIYDSKCKDYKDHFMRNAAWEEIAEILEQPVNKCKDDWAKLRNAFASALKRRRNKKSGQAAAALVPWKYEESLSFLLPYMECRSTKTNVTTTPESPPTEESPDESLPESPSTSRSQSQSSSSRGKPNKEPKLQELYDLMKSSQDLRRQKQNFRQDMDETDLFFLSMSKELKALPKLEQTK